MPREDCPAEWSRVGPAPSVGAAAPAGTPVHLPPVLNACSPELGLGPPCLHPGPACLTGPRSSARRTTVPAVLGALKSFTGALARGSSETELWLVPSGLQEPPGSGRRCGLGPVSCSCWAQLACTLAGDGTQTPEPHPRPLWPTSGSGVDTACAGRMTCILADKAINQPASPLFFSRSHSAARALRTALVGLYTALAPHSKAKRGPLWSPVLAPACPGGRVPRQGLWGWSTTRDMTRATHSCPSGRPGAEQAFLKLAAEAVVRTDVVGGDRWPKFSASRGLPPCPQLRWPRTT